MIGNNYGRGIDNGMLPTAEEFMVGVVIHELYHGTDKLAATAYRNNHNGWINNFPHHEGVTEQDEKQYFKELKEIKERKP